MNTKKLALMALFMSLVTVATMMVRIPIPLTKGYMNLGDSMVLLSAVIFGPAPGFIVGGIGSALADIFGGYPQWAPWTLVIKGMEAVLAAVFFTVLKTDRDKFSFRLAAVFVVATAWMVLGYFLAGWVMYDQKAAIAEIPFNLGQAGGSVVLASILYPVFSRVVPKDGDA